MKKFLPLMALCVLVSTFGFADSPHASLRQVKKTHHHGQHHHAHKAQKHKTAKHPHQAV